LHQRQQGPQGRCTKKRSRVERVRIGDSRWLRSPAPGARLQTAALYWTAWSGPTVTGPTENSTPSGARNHPRISGLIALGDMQIASVDRQLETSGDRAISKDRGTARSLNEGELPLNGRFVRNSRWRKPDSNHRFRVTRSNFQDRLMSASAPPTEMRREPE